MPYNSLLAGTKGRHFLQRPDRPVPRERLIEVEEDKGESPRFRRAPRCCALVRCVVGIETRGKNESRLTRIAVAARVAAEFAKVIIIYQ